MTELAIRTVDLGKQYKLGAHLRYYTLRDSLTYALAVPVRAAAARARGVRFQGREGPERIWALKDVSLEVGDGEVVAVIGRNGAGKTTLLKLLSSITEPTAGRAEVRGTVSSLLEVGAGFHSELTGRENVFLNGAILGMTRNEVRRKFDEIVEFAGVEKFIDTPVKRYSSGMYLRLAFAVAAHLEPDILVVDEVLAVGDAAFQRKCLGRMGEISTTGRTILFVSHNMSAVRELCPRTIWLDGGTVVADGPTAEVIDSYLLAVSQTQENSEILFEDNPSYDLFVRSARLVDSTGRARSSFEIADPPTIELDVELRRPVPGLFGIVRLSKDGTMVLDGESWDVSPNPLDELRPGRYCVRVSLPPRTFAPGSYLVHVIFWSTFAMSNTQLHSPRDLATFTLEDSTTRLGNDRSGFLTVPLGWDVDPVD